ncbi:MAG: hypothetical protein DRI46_13185, partial [Chloroflexi bacterium]
EKDIAQATVRIDQAVIDAVDDDWREYLYDLRTVDDIVKHVAYNLIENGIGLSQMDGWADQPDSNARVIDWPEFYYDLEVVEMK